MSKLFRVLPITPITLLLCLAFLWPVTEVLSWSVIDETWTTKHLETVFQVAAYRRIVFRTLEVAVICSLLCMVISYPFAYFISIQKPRLRAVLLLMTVVTMWVSVLVRTYAWMVVLGKEGLMNSAMQSLGIIDQPMQLIFTRGAVYLAMVQILLPITILATYSGMVSFDRTYYLASRILGATPIKAFLTVYLPMTISGVASGGLLVLLLSLGFFITPAMVGGPNDMLISNIISNEVTQTMNWNLAAALSLVLLIIGAMLVAIFLYVFKKIARI